MTIPKELRQIAQWVCCNRKDKIPFTPKGRKASISDSRTWSTYEKCKKAVEDGLFELIGFVFTIEDPYCCIDLDAPKSPKELEKEKEIRKRQKEIYEKFNSYAELSQSGKGVHIIVKGQILQGKRRDCVEVYSQKRFIALTGDRINKLPIEDRHDLLQKLYKEMGGLENIENYEDEDEPEKFSDKKILKLARKAENKDKFKKLWQGNWENDYPSHSEADHALISLLYFYTQSTAQIYRLFNESGLARKKSRRLPYIKYSISQIRANEPTHLEMEQINESIKRFEKKEKKKNGKRKRNPETGSISKRNKRDPSNSEPILLDFPPGLCGSIAKQIFDNAIRPVREVSIAGAIGLLAGICGRSFNVSGTGLNAYINIIGKTGIGKEGASSGINRIISACSEKMPTFEMILGPSIFASGQGLLKILDSKKCFLSVIGEIGLYLKQMCDPRANTAQIMLQKMLLDLYVKSGHNEKIQPMVYADTSKNTQVIRSPAISILGDSTPHSFFEGLTTDHIASGLVPRFLSIIYEGERPSKNENANKTPLPESIRNRLVSLAEKSFRIEQGNSKPIQIILDSQAKELLDLFDKQADQNIRNSENDTIAELWTRAHLKALKLAALLSVEDETVNQENAQYAISLVTKDILYFSRIFEKETYSVSVVSQIENLRNDIKIYFSMSAEQLRSLHINKKPIDLRKFQLIPWSYISKVCFRKKCFRDDRRGAQVATNQAIEQLVLEGKLVRVSREFLQKQFKARGLYFQVKGKIK